MDTRGAIKLRAPAPTLRFDEPRGDALTQLQRQGALAFDARTPDTYIDAQVKRLAVAMVLESRLLHLPTERLSRYQRSKDPKRVTLAELAGLHRPHRGVAGQAFEIAIAEACNQRVPEVVAPISWALKQLGVIDHHHPRMLVLGLEKLSDNADVWDELRDVLPGSARLRTGGRGRPATVGTVLDRLAASSWSSMGVDPLVRSVDSDDIVVNGHRPGRFGSGHASQLGRCDALVYTDTAIVPASMKINYRHVSYSGWRDVPLWITSGSGIDSFELSARARQGARWPIVVACLDQGGGFGAALGEAVALVDHVLGRIDPASKVPGQPAGYSRPPSGMERALLARRDQTIAEITADLRDRADPDARPILAPRMSFNKTDGVIPTLNSQTITDGWQERLNAGQVNLGHRHLWVRDYPGDPRERARRADPGRSGAPYARPSRGTAAPRRERDRRLAGPADPSASEAAGTRGAAPVSRSSRTGRPSAPTHQTTPTAQSHS